MSNMPNHESRPFPLIPLLFWVILFSGTWFWMYSQSDWDASIRWGIVLGAGNFLTILLTLRLASRRSAQAPSVDDIFSEIRSARNEAIQDQQKVHDPSWLAALEREAWFELLQTTVTEPKLERFVRIIPPQLQQLFPGSSMGLYVRGPQETLDLTLRMGDSFNGPASMHLSDCEAMTRGRMVDSNLIIDGPACACTHHGGVHTVFSACIPIVADDHYYGLLTIYHPLLTLEHQGNSSTAILQKGQALASALALYLKGMSLKLSLHEEALRDSLTGLFNRKYLEETLFREFAEATRRRASIGVVMVYPDQISAIRSTHGSKAAEQMLWEIGQRIPRYIRTEDIPCRYEEDVFCIILPTAALDISLQRGEKIRRELGGLTILFQNHPLTTTFSVGVTLFPQHSSTVHGLLTMTEMAMRNAQRQGGNRVAMPPQSATVNWD